MRRMLTMMLQELIDAEATAVIGAAVLVITRLTHSTMEESRTERAARIEVTVP